jgi:tetratricopeptide (TPR) repeat protein
MKKFLKVFIIFISGIFVGATLVFVIMKKNLEHMNELMSWEYISSESEAAINAYEFQSPEVGIYAFQRYIQLLNSYKGKNLILFDDKALLKSISLANVRLGNLYTKIGTHDKAEQCYSRAVDLYRESGKSVSLEELKQLIRKLDSNMEIKEED